MAELTVLQRTETLHEARWWEPEAGYRGAAEALD